LIDAFWDVRATTVSATYSASAQLTTTEIGMAPLNQTAHWQASAIALSTALTDKHAADAFVTDYEALI